MNDTDSEVPQPLPEQRVGAALRAAREAGQISLRETAKRLGYNSHTTLSAYERGSVMATEPVVEGYERVFGLAPGTLMSVLEQACVERHGDVWTKRRAHFPTQLVPEEEPVVRPEVAHAPRPSRRRALVIGGAVVLVLVASAVLAATLWSPEPARHASQSVPSPALSVVSTALDRADPKVAGCAGDASRADSVEVFDPPQHLVGVLELRFSSSCGASWGKFTPTPALAPTPPVTLEINVHRPADNAAALFQVTYDGQAAYGNMLTSRNECVYAELILHRAEIALPAVRTACKRGAG